MSRQRAIAAATLLLAFLALAAAIATSPHEYVFDERYYVDYVTLLRRQGFNRQFLESLNGTTGPLYAFVHYTLEPVTGLTPVAMRLANFALLLAVVAVLAAWLRRRGNANALANGAAILVVPMAWVEGGMALTSMPTLVLVSLSLIAQLRGVDAVAQNRSGLGWFAAGGLCLGAAVWGRQTVLVLVAVPLLLAALDRRLLGHALTFGAIVAAMTVPLVQAWHGLVPPNSMVMAGLSPAKALASLGYLGACFLLLAPRPEWLVQRASLAAAVILAIANAAFGPFVVCPLASTVDDFLSEPAMYAYGVVCGMLLLWCGTAFLVWMLRTTWQARAVLERVTINTGLLLAGLSPAFIANNFSSRYAVIALPYLILAAQPFRDRGPELARRTNLTMAAGCAVGLLSLIGYFWNPLTSDLVIQQLR